MGLKILKKLKNGIDTVGKKVDRLLTGTIADNIGDFINGVTGVSSSARQQYNYNQSLQEQAQNFNASQAEIERNWQTEMSNTARQRGVQDAINAGMNPILAVSEGGATSGAGAAATSPGASTGAGVGANPISMITELINASNTTARTQADNERTKIETILAPQLAMAEIAYKGALAGNAEAQKTYTTIMTNIDAELKKAQKREHTANAEGQEHENKMNKDLGTSKNEWGLYRAIKNSARSLFYSEYNPLTEK